MILVPLSIFLTVAANEPKNKIEIVPAEVNKAKEMIKVFRTPNNNGSITIHSANEQTMNFYLFDVEGKLVYQTVINKNEKQSVHGLIKGTYLYNAFQNDENLKGGKINVP